MYTCTFIKQIGNESLGMFCVGHIEATCLQLRQKANSEQDVCCALTGLCSTLRTVVLSAHSTEGILLWVER